MKIGDIKEPLLILLEDAHAAEQYLEGADSQFARRAYIRSIFAYIEGSVWILKQVCLKAKPLSGERRISPVEYALLAEESYELKNNGEPKVQTKFLRLPDNIKFTFKLINKLFKANIELGVGSKEWINFQKAIEIRHRITHPKNIKVFAISDEEIQMCQQVCSWFNELVHRFFQALIELPGKSSTRSKNATLH